MKRTIITFLFTAIVILPTMAQFKSAEIKVYGLTCSLCSRSVEKRLEKIDFIEEINTDLETTLTTIKLKDDVVIFPEELAKEVEKAGFSVGYITIEYNFDKDVNHCYTGRNETLTFLEPVSLKPGVHKLMMVEKDMMNKKMYREYEDRLPEKCKTEKRNYYVALADDMLLN